MTVMRIRRFPLLLLLAGIFCGSCTRTSIQFGDDPENSYAHIVFIDTISVELSTVITDSFETGGATSFLVGKYKDPYLGIVSAKSFFQMTVPAETPAIPSPAQYDSIGFIFHFNKYHYGDTSRVQTFFVNELSQSITYSYNNKLYNTSNVPVKPAPIGSKMISMNLIRNDSVEIRLNDSKGLELFSKLRQLSSDVTTADGFQNYFKGISLTTGDHDTTAVYGLTSAMVMRVYYHNTIPYPESKYIDFTFLTNDYAFNQVLTDRSGTGIVPGANGLTEIRALQTNNLSFLQPGAGVYLKMIFPSLRSILGTDKVIKLLKAELIIRPAAQSFDRNKYGLPSSLYLTQTDGSNISGAEVTDSTGASVQYAAPVIDELYGENNHYRFNITPYISQMLATAGSEDYGFYVMHAASASDMNVSRLVANNSLHGIQGSKLLLSVIIINK